LMRTEGQRRTRGTRIQHRASGTISEQWNEMGWQGKDPSTDFRYYNFSSVLAATCYLFSQ